MAGTNWERVTKGFTILVPRLRLFVERELKSHLGENWQATLGGAAGHGPRAKPQPLNLNDPQILLKLVCGQWDAVFKDTLGYGGRRIVSELWQLRTDWAHEQFSSNDVSSNDVVRALDSMERLLNAISAADAGAELQQMRMDLMRNMLDDQHGQEMPKNSFQPAEGKPQDGLNRWQEVVPPPMSHFEREPYTKDIDRGNPTCFLFLVDQSGSMGRTFAAQPDRSLAEGVADAINRLLRGLVRACSAGDGTVDRYQVGVIGYGDDISLGFSGALAGGCLRWVSEIRNNPLRSEELRKRETDRNRGAIEKVSSVQEWIEPLAESEATVMCKALRVARGVIAEFIQAWPGCFPPVVINITDGEANDGDPEPWAMALRGLASTNGNVLLLNIQLTPDDMQPIFLPTRVETLSNSKAQKLFRMSSVLPPPLLRQARSRREVSVADGARGFVFNADLVSLETFLDIGTRLR